MEGVRSRQGVMWCVRRAGDVIAYEVVSLELPVLGFFSVIVCGQEIRLLINV